MHKKLVTIFALVAVLFAFGCATKPPKSFVQNNANWFSVPIAQGLSHEKAWQKMADLLAKSFDLEVLNKDSGYIRTAWKLTVAVGKKGDVKGAYRKRVTVKFDSEENNVQMKCEAQWFDGDVWVDGFDQIDLDTMKNDTTALVMSLLKQDPKAK